MKKIHLYILAYFSILCIVFVFLIPPFEANDEPYHLEYINYIVKNSSLPNQLNENEKVKIEGHQFPLYYIISASLMKIIWGSSPVNFSLVYNKKHFSAGGPENLVPVFNHVYNNPFADNGSRVKFYFLRLFSVLLSVVNLYFIYRIAKLFFAEEKWANLCLFFAASIPQFIYVSSTVTNDSFANLLSTLSIYSFLIFLKNPAGRKIIFFSVVFSLSLLCKKTLFFLIPSVAISSAYSMYIGKMDRRTFGRLCISLSVFILLIAGWFYYRNYFLYNDILLNEIEKQTVPMHYDPKSIFNSYFLYPFIPGLFGSFFGVFGWMNVALPFIDYVIYFLICTTSAIGIIQKKILLRLTPQKIFVLCSLVICCGGVVYYNLSYTQHQGRFLFPVLSLVSISIIAGIKFFSSSLKTKISNDLILKALYLVIFLINLSAVYAIYRFYYIENNYL